MLGVPKKMVKYIVKVGNGSVNKYLLYTCVAHCTVTLEDYIKILSILTPLYFPLYILNVL